MSPAANDPDDREERLGRLTEELAAALAAGEAVDDAALAVRFAVATDDVAACRRALDCLRICLDEDPVDGPPELPRPTLPERYRLEDELGRGGMGVVYRATQPELGRSVAIKVLRPGELRFGDALRRFRNEARSLARLRHRHIVSIHDVGETPEGFVWYAMDLVDGGTLADEIARTGPLTPSRSVRVLRQVAAAIAHAHGQGIVHRDLKPQNVLIDAAGDAFVCDFGLARDGASNPHTLTGELLGTPAYMSPEQAGGEHGRIGEPADIWALGALLYECLTARGPFAGRPLHDTIRAILHDDPRPPRRVESRVPGELEAVCLKALAKRPADRYATALAFADDLERFADGRGVQARGPGALRRTARTLRRHRTPLVTAGAIAAVLLTLFLGFVLPTAMRRMRIDDATRALAIGHPAAALGPLRELAADLGDDDPAWAAFDLPLVQALHALVAERLEAGDVAGAEPLFAESIERVRRRRRAGRPGDPLQVTPATFAVWQFEFAVHAALGCSAPWTDPVLRASIDIDAGSLAAEPFATAWNSPSPGRRLAARAAAFHCRDALGLASFPGVPREDVLVAILREAGRLLATPEFQPAEPLSLSIPSDWDSEQLAAWWSADGEDALAALAVDPAEPVAVRALALHTWSIFVGLPTGELSVATPSDLQRRVDAAPRLIAEWQRWRSLPRDAALSARIALLAAGLADEGTFGFGRDTIHDTLQVAEAWLGLDERSSTAATLEAARTCSREAPTTWLSRALGVADASAVDVGEALRRAASGDNADAILWRSLASLRLPPDVRAPAWVRATGSRDAGWLPGWWAAASSTAPADLIVTVGVFVFEDAGITPRLLGERREPVRLGESIDIRWEGELGIEFGARTGARPLESASAALQLARQHHRPRTPFGAVHAEVSGRLTAGRDGPEFRLGRYGTTSRMPMDGGVHGSAGSGATLTPGTAVVPSVEYQYGGSLPGTIEVVLAVRLDAVDAPPSTGDLDAWRSAFERRLALAADDPDGIYLDIGAENFWSLPAARADLTRLAERQPERYLAGAWLAGATPAAGAASPDRDTGPAPTWWARAALHAPTPDARRAALACLAEEPGEGLSPRVAAAVLRAASDSSETLAPQFVTALDARARVSLWTFARTMALANAALLLIAAASLVMAFTRLRGTRAIAWFGWIAACLATRLDFDGFGIDGPPVPWLCAAAGLLGLRVAGSGAVRAIAAAAPLTLGLWLELAARGYATAPDDTAALLLVAPPLLAAWNRLRTRPPRR